MNGGMTMDIKQGIQDVLYLIITGILPLLITYGILFLKVKIKEQEKNLENDQLVKYIDAATDAISKAVLTVNQTYVDALKKEGKFDAEAQKTAKQMAIDKAKALITEDSKAAIETLYSDFEAYLNDAIEELVRENKVTC